MANPYQLSSIRTNLDSLRNIQGMDRQQTLVDTLMQKQKISEDYEKDIEAIQKDARDRSNKHSGVIDTVNTLADIFADPFTKAIIKAGTSGISLKQQKSGAKMLQHKALDRYSKNFMSEQADEFKKQADEAQLSSGDILRGAFGAGLTSYSTDKVMGGEKDSSTFKTWKEGRQAQKLVPKVEGSYTDYLTKSKEQALPGAYDDFLSTFKEQADKAKVSEMPIGIEEFAKDFKPEGLLDKAEYGKIYFGDEGFKPSMLDIDENILDSKIPGIKNLIETITKGGDMGNLSEELEGALKIPTLLQLLAEGRQ